MFYGLKKDEIEYISDIIKKFFNWFKSLKNHRIY
jgi:hypothetical protein